MDYDLTEIAATYDRGHDHGSAAIDECMRVVESHVDPGLVHDILDLACGTGRFISGLARHFNARVVGVDPSQDMLRRAQRQHARTGGFSLARGEGQRLPFRSGSFDLVFISMAFHHFDEPAGIAMECSRVLRPHGHVIVRTITAEQIPNYPFLPFFPTIRTLLEQRLPTVAATCGAFEAASFRTVSTEAVSQQIAPNYAAYAEKLAAGADTSLGALDPAEFQAGLQAMSMIPAVAGTPPIVEPIDFMVFEAAGPRRKA